jgi:hypothetical protein
MTAHSPVLPGPGERAVWDRGLSPKEMGEPESIHLEERSETEPHGRGRRVGQLLLVCAVIGAAVGVVALTGSTRALFNESMQQNANIGAGRIFPGTRSTSAFAVTDRSGGSAVDRSSPFAFAGDGRMVTTAAWSSAFASSRYVQFDLNAPLPAGISVSGASFRYLFASGDVGGTACVYVEVRRISDDALLATYGSAGSPLDCTTGTTLALLTQSIPIVGSTDAANDLRVRVYGSDSASATGVIDQATVTGSTPYSSFTLYPVRFADSASGTPVSAPWELQGP